MTPRTLVEKIRDNHLILHEDGQDLIAIDRHYLHEGSHHAVARIAEAGLRVRRPDLTFAVADHYVPTGPEPAPPAIAGMIDRLGRNAREHGVEVFGRGDRRQGIVHVTMPELGLTLPGLTVVCGDSHTATHGAFGSLAHGIGTSEVEHVLATQTLPQTPLQTMAVTVEGEVQPGVTAKDIVLAIIGRIGTAGGTGYALEFAGEAIQALSMEGRMTICNMAIEGGARAGLIAVDDTTIAYVGNRPFSPLGKHWDQAVDWWKTLHSDPDAAFDHEIVIEAAGIEPQVTWGTSPEMVVPVGGCVPDPAAVSDPVRRSGMEKALAYMGLSANMPIREIRVDKVFIGSCTNSRIEDLRAAAAVVKGRRKADSVMLAMVVPGSGLVKAQAESEGLDRVFLDAGFEWREPGCSMCLAMNADRLEPGERCASTSNRNFEGRQGQGGRTHLVSPAMAAAAGVLGHFADVRAL